MKTVNIIMDGKVLFENFVLHEKAAFILPVNVKLKETTVVKSTAEIIDVGKESITFRLSQPNDIIILKTDKAVLPGEGYKIARQTNKIVISSDKNIGSTLIIKLT